VAQSLVAAVVIGAVLAGRRPAAAVDSPTEARLAPYAADPGHLWNRLHQALFVRTASDGSRHVHTTDPLLYRGGTFLLDGESHRRAIGLLDEFLAGPADRTTDDPLRRLVLQRDLWAAFDYVGWYSDDWVHKSRHEPAAVALRTRLARAIGRLALADRDLAAVADNYAVAVRSKQFPAAHDPNHPERPFLPPDLFDPAGPWVRFHETTAEPMAQQHFDGAGGRAVHVIFLRLPGGRAATERYLKELSGTAVRQFPPGTMVAMVRRALTVDRAAKVQVTPLTELVQIRVYRRIPAHPRANLEGDFGEQDVYEFVLDRKELFAGQGGLRPDGPTEPAEPFSRTGGDPVERTDRPPLAEMQLKSCIQCHQAPGVHSVLSTARARKERGGEVFRTYGWDVEMNYTVTKKVSRYDWGLLQGMLEAHR
jgi:hypothetical protein